MTTHRGKSVQEKTCEISTNCFNQSNIYTFYEVLGGKTKLITFSKLLKKSSKKRKIIILFSFEYCILSTVFTEDFFVREPQLSD